MPVLAASVRWWNPLTWPQPLAEPGVWTPLHGAPLLLMGLNVAIGLCFFWIAGLFVQDARQRRQAIAARQARGQRVPVSRDPFTVRFGVFGGSLLGLQIAALVVAASMWRSVGRVAVAGLSPGVLRLADWWLALMLPLFAWVWLAIARMPDGDGPFTPLAPMAGLPAPQELQARIRQWLRIQGRHGLVGLTLASWLALTTLQWLSLPRWQNPGLDGRLLWVLVLLLGFAVLAFHRDALRAEWQGVPSWGWIRWALRATPSATLPAGEADHRLAEALARVGGPEQMPLAFRATWHTHDASLEAGWQWLELLLLAPDPAQRPARTALRPLLLHPDRDIRLRATQLLGRRMQLEAGNQTTALEGDGGPASEAAGRGLLGRVALLLGVVAAVAPVVEVVMARGGRMLAASHGMPSWLLAALWLCHGLLLAPAWPLFARSLALLRWERLAADPDLRVRYVRALPLVVGGWLLWRRVSVTRLLVTMGLLVWGLVLALLDLTRQGATGWMPTAGQQGLLQGFVGPALVLLCGWRLRGRVDDIETTLRDHHVLLRTAPLVVDDLGIILLRESGRQLTLAAWRQAALSLVVLGAFAVGLLGTHGLQRVEARAETPGGAQTSPSLVAAPIAASASGPTSRDARGAPSRTPAATPRRPADAWRPGREPDLLAPMTAALALGATLGAPIGAAMGWILVGVLVALGLGRRRGALLAPVSLVWWGPTWWRARWWQAQRQRHVQRPIVDRSSLHHARARRFLAHRLGARDLRAWLSQQVNAGPVASHAVVADVLLAATGPGTLRRPTLEALWGLALHEPDRAVRLAAIHAIGATVQASTTVCARDDAMGDAAQPS